MVQLVCQRCGASNEHEDLKEAKFKMEHAKGCGSKIGIVVVSSKATAKATPPEEPTVEKTTESEEEKPKKVKRTKKSEQSDS